MTLEFLHADAGAAPPPLAELAPANPFCTAAYAEARRATGTEPLILGVGRDGVWVTGCYGFLFSERLARCLDIQSLPGGLDATFWNGLLAFCRERGIARVRLNTFGSTAAAIPPLAEVAFRRPRCEHIIRLRDADLWRALSETHRRKVKRARKAGLELRRSRSAEACREHARMMAASMDRRKQRGEAVPDGAALTHLLPFLTHGAGELFQAVSQDGVLASLLILRAARGAYYQSGGSAPEGMQQGAPYFLMHETCCRLAAEDLEIFNLGGADAGSGLEQFKTGFGGQAVPLEAAELSIALAPLGKLTAAGFLAARKFRHLVGGHA